MKSILLTVILSTTAITLAAISLDYAGAIDMRFGGEGLQIKIESGEKRLPQTGDVSDGTL
ncbi:hypothetical protein [Leptothoe spongobia]|uniref:Uncharacterized protein n=1 Tax=Leptothoe spongobia TAU-MAC 1115 TaxID=1967444 RepID=A0A947DD30_9CYAN|nr:hypothetical protein [Leptothoe spongobia]MBT9314129.1 hypothetical protein [Leptothoe spongobia TAU-MAC 1115]